MVDWNDALAYSTGKEVVIRSVRLRLLKLFIQFIVLGYVAYEVVYYKGYQKTIHGRGFWQTKTQGIAHETAGTDLVWDAQDFVQPAKMEDEVFLATNFLRTVNQTRTSCAGNDPATETCSVPVSGRCCCSAGSITANGKATGSCTSDGKQCIVEAWCPIEATTKPSISSALVDLEYATIFFRNFVRWEDLGIYLDSASAFDNDSTKYIWSIARLLADAGVDYETTKTAGASFVVHSVWDCNFDHNPSRCTPTIHVEYLDGTESFSKGSNFRLVNTYRTESDPFLLRRDLLKVYGLDFVFVTTARGHYFDPVSLGIAIGSGIGVMIFATLISDLVTMWCMRHSPFYRNRKFMNVNDQRAELARRNWVDVLSDSELNRAYM